MGKCLRYNIRVCPKGSKAGLRSGLRSVTWECDMEEQPLISIIVPIYMIDRYVGICIESIVNQTYRNLEIILVDDGSKDRCPEICDLYASKDSRIRVIHKENGGLVSARKAGLAAATGGLISYVDGDDWIGPSFIEKMVKAYRETEADMICAGQTRVIFDRAAELVDRIPAGVYEGEELYERVQKHMMSDGSFYRPGISTYVWNKLFRRDIVYDPQMQVDEAISIGEDAAVTYPALLRCRKIAVTEHTDYHYRQREDSMLKQSTSFAAEAGKLRSLYEYMNRWKDSIEDAEGLHLAQQITDYVLSICIMRSGGRLPEDDYSTFDKAYYGKRVVIYSAGTFGQQLVNRFKETGHCRVTGWVDDDYWEYRRCCLDVDPVEQITEMEYDFVLIASVSETFSEKAIERLIGIGVNRRRILTVSVPKAEELRLRLTKRFLYGGNSHA